MLDQSANNSVDYATYLSYTPPVIVFFLALMGTAFKSTKSDAAGKTIHTPYGLPALTRTGKIVMILLTMSFFLSLFSVWRSAKSAVDANIKAAAAEEREKGIDLGVKTAVSKFDVVLTEQKSTGERIARGIDESTSKLNKGINDSTALLGSRVEDSITLLNGSTEQLRSLTDPITSLKVSVMAELPLTDPVFKDYRRKLEGLARPGAKIVQIMDQSRWPDPQDKTASEVLSDLRHDVRVRCSLYKVPLSKTALTNGDLPPADLALGLFGYAYALDYDIESQLLRVFIKEAVFFPRNDPRLAIKGDSFETLPWFKKPAGGINNIADLRNSQLTAEIFVPGGQEVITRQIRMTSLSIIVSDELQLSYVKGGMVPGGIPLATAVHHIPKMRELARQDGTIYFYQIPRSLG
jgi:hypothetical protein